VAADLPGAPADAAAKQQLVSAHSDAVVQLAVAAARGERTFTVSGEAIAFAAAMFGPQAAARKPTAAVATAPLLADAELTNAVELRGMVAVAKRISKGSPFHEKARRAQAAGAVALVVINTEDAPFVLADPDGEAADIVIPALCVGSSDGERLLLGGAAEVAFGYDNPAELERGRAEEAAQAERVVRAPPRPGSCRHNISRPSHSPASVNQGTKGRLRSRWSLSTWSLKAGRLASPSSPTRTRAAAPSTYTQPAGLQGIMAVGRPPSRMPFPPVLRNL
jgi:hypothetical protein